MRPAQTGPINPTTTEETNTMKATQLIAALAVALASHVPAWAKNELI